MNMLLKGGRVVDPLLDLDEKLDVLIGEDGRIAEVAQNIPEAEGTEVVNCKDCFVGPGLTDMHVHFRDPGFEYKEDMKTGSRAAVHGGFSDVATMPNTSPICDTGIVVSGQIKNAEGVGLCQVHPIGALTKGELGKELAEIGDMVNAGAVAFSDDGHGVQSAGMMRSCMEYVSQFNRSVIAHCENESLSGDGVVNEGRASLRLGMFGWPGAAEEIEVIRDIELCRLTGCALHLAHISTKRSLEMVRSAKKEGLPVTCEVTPHHLFLTEEEILEDSYNTNLKVNPPLRTAEDAAALIEGVKDGSIDAIVSDHAPHAVHEKACEFEIAYFGTIGLETTVPLVMTNLVNKGEISIKRFFELLSASPRSILRLPDACIQPGSQGSLVVVDPNKSVTITEDYFLSKAKNSAFLGMKLIGVAKDLFVNGKQVLKNYELR